jgi:hypothetical protein
MVGIEKGMEMEFTTVLDMLNVMYEFAMFVGCIGGLIYIAYRLISLKFDEIFAELEDDVNDIIHESIKEGYEIGCAFGNAKHLKV